MRRALSITLVVLELLLGVAGLLNGGQLMVDPTGSAIGLRVEVLAGTPFSSFFAPGLILLVAVGVVPLVAAVSAVLRLPWSRWAHVAAGLMLTGWMTGQLILLGYTFFLQALFSGFAVVMLALALVHFALDRRGPLPV